MTLWTWIARLLGAQCLMFWSGLAASQCVNESLPSCAVYESCFAKYCPCAGDPSEYFMTYGKKYCVSFLANANFGAAGKKWRDATLVCLQEKVVPHLDISQSPKCDCRAMRKIAFDSHVACYTQPEASICNLPMLDLKEIMNTIDRRDLFTSEGWRQMKSVAAICVGKAPDAARRTEWRKATTLP